MSDQSASQNRPLLPAPQRYARAFFELASEQNALTSVETDVAHLRAMLKESDELRRLFASPLLRRELVARAVSALTQEAKLGALTAQFLQVIVRNGRASDISFILDAFTELLAKSRGEVVAEVTAARALSQAQMDAIAAALMQAMAGQGVKKVNVRARVDATVLGGVRVQIGSHLYDGTLKGKLQRLAHILQNRKAA